MVASGATSHIPQLGCKVLARNLPAFRPSVSTASEIHHETLRKQAEASALLSLRRQPGIVAATCGHVLGMRGPLCLTGPEAARIACLAARWKLLHIRQEAVQ